MTRKVYWENPYLYEIEAIVEEKQLKDNKCYVKLNKTIFYPDMSGGQPGDIGTIDGINILNTYEDEDSIVHVLEKNLKQLNVSLKIDPATRFDLMQQHSGQHLLSGVFYNLYDAETVGFHLGEEIVTIDITMSKIDLDEINKVELMCNKIIQSNFKVKSYFATKDSIASLPVRKPPTVDHDIRIVEIEGYDFSPCGGTHVSNTGEISLLKIRKWEKYKGNTRIEFICGNRALNDYQWKNDYIKSIALMMSSKDKDVLSKVEKIYQDKLILEKEVSSLKSDLVTLRSQNLLSDYEDISGIRVISNTFTNETFKDLSFLNSFICNNNDNIVTLFTLTSEIGCQFIVSKSKDVNINLSQLFKDLSNSITIKGGGNNNTIQGNLSIEDIDKITHFVKDWLSKTEH